MFAKANVKTPKAGENDAIRNVKISNGKNTSHEKFKMFCKKKLI